MVFFKSKISRIGVIQKTLIGKRLDQKEPLRDVVENRREVTLIGRI